MATTPEIPYNISMHVSIVFTKHTITVYFTHTQNRPHVTANANAIRYVGNPWVTQLGGFAIQNLIMVSGNSMSCIASYND